MSNPTERARLLAQYRCASCDGPASFISDSDTLICESCQTGRWLTKRKAPMSEASYEEEKASLLQATERALHANYHIVRIDECSFGVITVESRCLTQGKEYAAFRLISGLERLSWDQAVRAVQALNQGNTKESDTLKSP
jgi:DNA-directed RNA polymerase subunit RPC12/RpoP